jgi:SAM-dependent methyltransferase
MSSGRPALPSVTDVATHQHHHGPVHLDEADWREFAAQTELEGELLIGFVTGTVERIKALRTPEAPPVRRVLDIGSGPGVGTCELARLFPKAHVVAVDGSPAMLSRAAQRADEHGLGPRIGTHLAELPGGLDGLAPVDLIWASMSLHHVGDEIGLLSVLHPLLEPQGVLAVAEFAEPMRGLPDVLDVGPPGLAERLDRAGARWFAAMREGLTDAVPSTGLSSMLTSAGFEVLSSRIARESFDPPLSEVARQMVLGHLRRIRKQLDELLDNEDLEAIDVLSDTHDPRGVMRRSDVFVAASREIVIARPAGHRRE